MFTRIPRGNKSNPNRNSGGVRIDRKFVQSFENAVLDQGLQTIMLHTAAEIKLTVGSTGGSSMSLEHQGKTVADKADITKILNIDSFINSERKSVQKEATSASLEASLSAIVEMSKEPNAGPPVTKLSPGYLDVYRGVSAQMNVLASNAKAIEALEVIGEANELVKNYLLAQATRIRSAAGKFIRYRAWADEEEPEKLNKFLKDEKVLNWVFLKLTQQKLQVNSTGFQIKNLLFPKDPSKGLAISYYELMSKDIRDNQGGILSGMALTHSLLSDVAFVRRFCNIADDVNIHDFTSDIGKSLMNVPIMVVPPYIDVDDVFDILAKQGLRGFAWNVGSSLTAQDNLRFLGTLMKRIRYVALARANSKHEVFEQIFTGFSYQQESPSKDVYVQLKSFVKDHKDYVAAKLHAISSAGDTPPEDRLQVVDLLQDILQISRMDKDSSNLIEKAIGLRFDRTVIAHKTINIPGIPIGSIGQVEDVWSTILARRDTRTDREANKAVLRRVMDKLPGSNAKAAKSRSINRVGSVRSSLGATAISTLQVLRNQRFNALADVLEAWFRSFLTLEVQKAVAQLVLAKLEWHLSQPLESTRNERMLFLNVNEFEELSTGLATSGEEGEGVPPPEETDEDDAGAAE